jgi:hypothetical protein
VAGMPIKDYPQYGRPACPQCQMSMIAIDGFGLDPEQRTFQCLRCDNIEKLQKPRKKK